jgi:signal transduction histidine kinase
MLGRLAATVAHEVRNPLGGMTTALDTVRKFGDDPTVRAKSLDLIERGLRSIGTVVNSVLAFHRMPADSRKLTPSDLEDLRILVGPETTRRHLSLSWDSSVNAAVRLPATETRQIALNLLLNACAASPPGSEIRFRAWIETTALHLEVCDAGSGLPNEAIVALKQGGSASPGGLGIAVVHDLIHGLGGRVEIKQVSQGAGSCIVVSLPTDVVMTEEAAA